MTAEQPIYKDLSGVQKAKLKDFVFNPKAIDPAASDRTPEELYINTADNLLKHHDDNLNLRYAVPGIVRPVAPNVADLDYEIGTEWQHATLNLIWKLLDKPTVNGTLEARWVLERDLVPLIKVNSHQTFYVDADNGSDTNDGLSSADAFKTIGGATAKINATYDFNGRFIYTLRVISLNNSMPATRIYKPVGATTQQFVITADQPGTIIKLTGVHGFLSFSDMFLRISNFTFVGGATTQSCVYAIDGRIYFEDNKLTGNFSYPILTTNNNQAFLTDNTIEDVSSNNLVRIGKYAEYSQSGAWHAVGANTFSQIYNFSNQSIANFTAAASHTLDPGATVTGRRVALYGDASVDLARADQIFPWGDERSTWIGAGSYRGRSSLYTYSHWVEGMELSLSGTDLNLAPGEVLIKLNQGDKQKEYFGINTFLAQTIPFPAILATQNEAYVYAEDTEKIVFYTAPPDPVNLLLRVCLGKVTTLDNTTFATVEPEISERSPALLDSFAIPGSFDSCSVTNLVTTTLNNTLAGETIPLDSGSFSTSSPSIFTLDGDSIVVNTPGVYKIEQDANFSVATNGAQRPSVAIRIAINGVQRLKAGRTGYIRRAGGHYRSSAFVTARATLNAGDKITGIGFRDAIGGTVTCPAGESELFIMRLS